MSRPSLGQAEVTQRRKRAYNVPKMHLSILSARAGPRRKRHSFFSRSFTTESKATSSTHLKYLKTKKKW